MKTFNVKKSDIKRNLYIVDAKDKILGRVAAKVATVLRGKHKAIFTPSLDTGDNVIVINSSLVRFTGRKLSQKVYRRYSGYPGGLREVSLAVMLKNKPNTVMKLAIRRMLPTGRLGSDIIKKLKIYSDEKHPFIKQNPTVLEIK